MVNRQIDAMAELQNAFQILIKNWVLAIPTALASLLAGALLVFVFATTIASLFGAGVLSGERSGMAGLLAGGGGLMLLIGVAAIVVVTILAQAVVMIGAERVWQGHPADLGHAISAALGRLAPLIVLLLIGIVVAIVCGFLVLLLGLGILLAIVLGFFFMYAVPAIVIGNEGAMQALGTSYRLVRANLSPSAIAFLGIVVVSFVGSFISNIFLHVAVLGLVIWFAVGGLTSAYSALVAVRFYDLLRGSAASSISAAAPRTGPTP